MAESKNWFVLLVQLALLGGIYTGLKAWNYDKHVCLAGIARYILYVLLIRGMNEGSILLYNISHKKSPFDVSEIARGVKNYAVLFGASVGVLIYSEQRIVNEDFVLLFAANLVLKYFEMENKSETISYGVGMACSFFEGYLAHVIPSDGHRFVGFQENIESYENAQGVVFPVRRLFIIITKSLFCPPDLKDFNKENREDLPLLEACQSLPEVMKDCAGVKNRSYKNSAYMIRRADAAPVFLSAECATPLHTLHNVVNNKLLYDEMTNINKAEVVEDFTRTLSSILSKSPQCKGKCELVYFDDTDPEQNLASVLLEKIREIEPNFEKIKRN